MAELSVAKSSSNLNISYQQIHLLQQLLSFGNKPSDISKNNRKFILPNANNLVDDGNIMIDFAHT